MFTGEEGGGGGYFFLHTEVIVFVQVIMSLYNE